jgi:hypothetical protein
MFQEQRWSSCSLRLQRNAPCILYHHALEHASSKPKASRPLVSMCCSRAQVLQSELDEGQLATLYHTPSPDPWYPVRGLLPSIQPILYTAFFALPKSHSVHQAVNSQPNQYAAQTKDTKSSSLHRHSRAAFHDLHFALAELRHTRGITVDTETGECGTSYIYSH